LSGTFLSLSLFPDCHKVNILLFHILHPSQCCASPQAHCNGAMNWRMHFSPSFVGTSFSSLLVITKPNWG
jgi:hypothetical protein